MPLSSLCPAAAVALTPDWPPGGHSYTRILSILFTPGLPLCHSVPKQAQATTTTTSSSVYLGGTSMPITPRVQEDGPEWDHGAGKGQQQPQQPGGIKGYLHLIKSKVKLVFLVPASHVSFQPPGASSFIMRLGSPGYPSSRPPGGRRRKAKELKREASSIM